MKKIVTVVCILFLGLTQVQSQSFNSPESVEFDSLNNRWLVGNNGSGTIISYYPQSGLKVAFCAGLTSGPHGIEIMGNTLYCCDGSRIKGYDLANGNLTFNLNLGATFLNGLTTDGVSNLFATDFSGKKIYRIQPNTNSYNLMTTTVKTPNGIYYDGVNNRCVFVTWGNAAAIQAMSLVDSTVSTLLTTSLSNIDGITRDNSGYWFVTAWGGNKLCRIVPGFSSAPVTVMSGLSSPADIDVNSNSDSIGIPNSGSLNNVVFYTNTTTGTDDIENNIVVSIYPNPVKNTLNIKMPESKEELQIKIYASDCKIVATKNCRGNGCNFNVSHLLSGLYVVSIIDTNGNQVARQEFIKQ